MQTTITIPEDKRYGVTFAREQRNASLPQTVTDGTGKQVPNPDLIASDEAYVAWVLALGVDSWCTQAGVANAPPPAPPPPGTINGVPQEVSRRQARQALALAGKLSLVPGCIAAIPDATQRQMVQIEWDDSQVFLRQRPTLIALATNPAPYGLGMTLAALDAIFVQAATL